MVSIPFIGDQINNAAKVNTASLATIASNSAVVLTRVSCTIYEAALHAVLMMFVPCIGDQINNAAKVCITTCPF